MTWRRRLPPALHRRDYTLLWITTLVTGFGSQMVAVAVGWQVYAIHRDPLDLGLIGLMEFIPLPLLALPAGQLADRVSRRLVIVGALAVEIVTTSLLLVVSLEGARRGDCRAGGRRHGGRHGRPDSRGFRTSASGSSRDRLCQALAIRTDAAERNSNSYHPDCKSELPVSAHFVMQSGRFPLPWPRRAKTLSPTLLPLSLRFHDCEQVLDLLNVTVRGIFVDVFS